MGKEAVNLTKHFGVIEQFPFMARCYALIEHLPCMVQVAHSIERELALCPDFTDVHTLQECIHGGTPT
jgi:hypothetical protein